MPLWPVKQKNDVKAVNQSGSGLGDIVEAALKTVGITSERVSRWLGVPCRCNERKEKLNQLGAWALRIIRGKTDDAVRHLDEMINEKSGIEKNDETGNTSSS